MDITKFGNNERYYPARENRYNRTQLYTEISGHPIRPTVLELLSESKSDALPAGAP